MSTFRAVTISTLILLLAGLLLGVGWYGSRKALNPERSYPAWSLADFPDLDPELITFPSATGVTLEGRFFAGEHDGTIVLLHGFSTWQDQVLPQAQVLNQAGYYVLTYDARHPRYGDGVYSTLGILEREDLIAATDYLLTRDDVDPERIGTWGISLDAATVILAGALDEHIAAIAAESSFSDAENVIDSSFQRYIGLPSFPFGPITRKISEWRAGASLNDARPVDAIATIDGRPILLIHGQRDDSVPADHSERLLDASIGDIQVWWVPDAGHSNAHEIAGEEYARRLVEFFDNALINPEDYRAKAPAVRIRHGAFTRVACWR